MTIICVWAATLITVVLAPFFAYLGLIALAALGSTRGRAAARAGPAAAGPRFALVIPAHDEEANIASTVASCRGVDYDPGRFAVYVIADNCTDETAARARAAGATVVERADAERRSKGHALEYFFGRLAADGPADGHDATVIVDADTVVDPGLLAAFAAAWSEGHDWLQAYYTVSNPDASWRTRMLTYAFSLFNGVWLAGQEGLGLGVALRGNGMCFSARGLARCPWRAYGLTEDLEFSWLLRLSGERVRFVAGTRVLGEMVSRGGPAAASQRRRWEAGRAELRGRFLGPLLRSDRLGWRAKLLYAVDLWYPPLSTLPLGLLLASGVHALARLDAGALTASRALAPVHLLMAAAMAAYAAAPLRVVNLPARHLISLFALPYYMVWKAWVKLTGGRPKEWLRTRREPRPRDA